MPPFDEQQQKQNRKNDHHIIWVKLDSSVVEFAFPKNFASFISFYLCFFRRRRPRRRH